MASYTMELREYIEAWSQDIEEMSHKDRIETGREKLFDFDYPIFNEEYRKDFETKFIRKFYMREIGFETEELFKFQLETWLLINMPYYNKMFESELIDFDPLENSKMNNTYTLTKNTDETIDNTTNGNSSSINHQTKVTDMDSTVDGNTTTDNFSRQLESNNPDSRLAITTNDGQGVIEYASNIKENSTNDNITSHDVTSVNNTDTVNGNTTDNTNITGNTTTDKDETENYSQNRTGKIGVQTYSKMLQEYRETFLRIENKIFSEMNELFMLVY